MASIATTNVSLVSSQTVQNSTSVQAVREVPPNPQIVQQQLTALSQVVAEKNLKTADSRKRGVMKPEERVHGGFAPEEKVSKENPKLKAPRKHSGQKLDVEA
ncbi:MAG: hypothetical protein GX589_03870 [Deltaproteobacteria bacterium]|nr:hypothetical protein [Deltaproteobacteria bacterium]